MMKSVGILTAGGDSPGLNAAIRAVAKIMLAHKYKVIGFKDGFEGLAYDRFMRLDMHNSSGILTAGGTIVQTSRHKPTKMPFEGAIYNRTDAIKANYLKHGLECLICIGGGGTHKSALSLAKTGINVITIPKTIDNDLACTDSAIGFDSALRVATEALDNLHSTASSHKRVMLLELMGHRAGWLALGSGLAGGADVILLPEIPYSEEKIAAALRKRTAEGKLFSIIPVAEGAISQKNARRVARLSALVAKCEDKVKKAELKQEIGALTQINSGRTLELAQYLERATKLETRVTILGHLQRGGIPSPVDRILAARLGKGCAEAILAGKYSVMVASRGDGIELVPLREVAGQRKTVPIDHPWMAAARELGISFGD